MKKLLNLILVIACSVFLLSFTKGASANDGAAYTVTQSGAEYHVEITKTGKIQAEK